MFYGAVFLFLCMNDRKSDFRKSYLTNNIYNIMRVKIQKIIYEFSRLSHVGKSQKFQKVLN